MKRVTNNLVNHRWIVVKFSDSDDTFNEEESSISHCGKNEHCTHE